MVNTQGQTYNHFSIIQYANLFNWSVNYHLEKQYEYNQEFDLVRIGDVIKRNTDKIVLSDGQEYRRVKIRLWGKGVVERDRASGKDIGTKNQYRVSAGQFIMSKIDARNGAFGIVPEALEGAITTQDFLSYNLDKSRLHPKFLKILTTTKQFLKFCQGASTGTTGRRRIDERFFLNIQIPLPTLTEQQKIVDAYNEKMVLADEQEKEAESIKVETQNYLFTQLGIQDIDVAKRKNSLQFIPYSTLREWGVNKLKSQELFGTSKFDSFSLDTNPNLANSVFRGKNPKYDKEGKAIILNQKCIRWNKIEVEHAKTVRDDWFNSLDKNIFTQPGDVLINSTGEGTIGRASHIDRSFSNFLYDSHILCLRLNQKLVNPEYFTILFNSTYGQKQVDMIKSAQSTKQTELGVKNLKKIVFPVPEMDAQNEIVEYQKNQMLRANDLFKKSRLNRDNALSDFEQEIFMRE